MKIYVDKSERPHFFLPCQVLFPIHQKVGEELEQLQSLRVIRPVQFANWAASIVLVIKTDG